MELILADNKIAGLIAIAIRGKKLKNDVIKKKVGFGLFFVAKRTFLHKVNIFLNISLCFRFV